MLGNGCLHGITSGSVRNMEKASATLRVSVYTSTLPVYSGACSIGELIDLLSLEPGTNWTHTWTRRRGDISVYLLLELQMLQVSGCSTTEVDYLEHLFRPCQNIYSSLEFSLEQLADTYL